MAIFVTILGSGTGVPSLTRASCSVLVATARERIVLDAGCGTIHRLVAAGHNLCSVTHLVLSHFHPDHSGELASFLFANKYPHTGQRQVPLTLIGGPGLRRFFDALTAAWGHWIDLGPERFHLVELAGGDTWAGDTFRLDCAPVVHNPESLAYRITGTDGGRLVYSGDTDECESLVHLARGVELLICESARPDAMKVAGHMTPSLAGRIAARAGVGHLVLTHLYPECETVDLAAECRRTWDGPLTVAQDLMRIRLAAGRAAVIETPRMS